MHPDTHTPSPLLLLLIEPFSRSSLILTSHGLVHILPRGVSHGYHGYQYPRTPAELRLHSVLVSIIDDIVPGIITAPSFEHFLWLFWLGDGKYSH